MRICTVAVVGLLVGLVAATIDLVPHRVADNEFLEKQRKVLEIYWHVGQAPIDPEQRQIAASFSVQDHFDNYKDPELVRKFVNYYEHGFFKPRGEPFSPLFDKDQKQAKILVDLLYSAKDFDTFYKTAVWARAHMNQGQFVYAFSVALRHREDTYDIVLPSFYEVYPHLFVTSDVIEQALQARLEGKGTDLEKPYVIMANFSGYPYSTSEEDLLSYLTEDVTISSYAAWMHYRYPFWAKMDDYGQENYKRRGDHFYFGLKHMLARYNLERYSNHLPDVEPIEIFPSVKLQVGHNARIRLMNGAEVPSRPRGMTLYNPHTEYVRALETRLRDAIDTGYVMDVNFTKHSLRDPQSIELLGRIVEGNEDSMNKDLYGSFYRSLLFVASGLDHPDYRHRVMPSLLENPVTALRDPLHYRIAKRVMLIFDQFKNHLPPYTATELAFPGVRVEDVSVDKLLTYFQKYDFELNNAIHVPSTAEAGRLNVVARTLRLTHKPFSYRVRVSSDREVDAFVRVFVGPRYDAYGKMLTLDEKRHNMVYLDSFVYRLRQGDNVLERNSKQFTYYGNLPYSFSKLYQHTLGAMNSNGPVYMDDFVNKFGGADQLVLPRGRRSGLPLCMYVIVTRYAHDTASKINPHTDEVGSKVSLFPFDRPINEVEFNVPNSHLTHVLVFHRPEAEEDILV